MQLRNKQDFWSGVMFTLLGLGFAWKATSYSMGTAARMGPGYFPHWLGIIMAVLGAVILLGSLRLAVVCERPQIGVSNLASLSRSELRSTCSWTYLII